MRHPRAVITALAATALALAGLGTGAAQAADTPIYLDPSYSFDERAADLVSRMTPAEKASQSISSMAPAIPRLGIPAYGWWNEALHGVSRLQYLPDANATTLRNTTSYPIDQSLGSSWDPDLIHRVASAISDEAREVAPDNRLNLDFYSPTMNLERDPRWGRNDEAYGEDPYLVTKLVDQFVNGMEGKDQQGRLLPGANGFHKTVTTIKHYAANNSEANRRTGSSDMDGRTLREYYTKAFRKIIQEADPGSVMSAYNSVNGTPVSADPYLLDTLLRQTFGFDGYVTSDCDAVFEMVRSHRWQPPSWTRPIDNTERNAFAMAAGTDLNCNTGYKDAYNYLNRLPAALKEQIPTLAGTFTANDLDTSLVRLFTARMKLGEFDDPSAVPWVTQARSRVAQGSWTNDDSNAAKTETPARLALAREAGDKSMVLLKNATTTRKDGTSGKLLPLHVPSSGAFKVAVMGFFANPAPDDFYLGGYSSIQGPPGQANEVSGYTGLKQAIQAIDPDAQVDYLRGFTGTATTAAGLDTVDPAAVAAAADYDAVIVYTATDDATANEDRDRASLRLPGAQEDLIRDVAARNPNTIAYMETIGPMEVQGFEPDVPAILWSSYNGQRKGEALADVVLGDHDPSGRLPSTWYRDVNQLPDITDYRITPAAGRNGRTAWYFSGPVAYPFGHGLSYTSFAYSGLSVSKTALDANDAFDVSVDVRNTGAVAGTETVQLYVSTPDAAPAAVRPIKRLQGFQKVALAPGQTKTVTMTVKVPDLAFFDQAAGRWVVDPGRYGIQVARSADDVAATQDVQVSGTLEAVPSVVTVKPTMEGDVVRDVKSRVQFPSGVVVRPDVTVAMSDDTLYGAIRKGASKPLPSGMTVTYASNRPDVVSVAADGTVRTVAPGVAKVTATVSDQGVERSRSFVVRVVSAIRDLTVGGKPLSAFQPGEVFDYDTTDYDVIVPDGAAVPKVAVAKADAGADISIEQAAEVPGTATVKVGGPAGVSRTYTVFFAHPARSDAFDGATVGPQWQWIRQDAGAERISAGSLVLTPEAGDLTGAANTATNLLVQPAAGDWTLESRLDFSVVPHATGQQGGIIAYQGDDDWLKLGWEFSSGAARLTETSEDSLSGAPVTMTLASLPTQSLLGDGRTLWLRMERNGVRYRTWYSTDGKHWRFVYETGGSLSAVKVGVFAYKGAATDSDLTVSFDGVRIANGAVSPGGGSPGGGGMPGGGGTTVHKPRIASRRIHVTRKRQAAVRIRCGASAGKRCRGLLTLVSRREVAAERTFSIPADRTASVRVKLERRVFRRLVRERRIKTRIAVLTRGADGRLRRAAATVTLLAPSRHRGHKD